MDRTGRIGRVWAMLASLALAAGGALGQPAPAFAACTGSNYGTYDCPFTATSIWNLPIQAGAVREPVGLDAAVAYKFRVGAIGVHREQASDTLRSVYKRNQPTANDFHDYCEGGPPNFDYDLTKTFYQLRLPSGLVVNNALDNGYHTFVRTDDSIVHGFGWERCAAGSHAAQMYGPGNNIGYTITSDGWPSVNGGHGAGMMSLLGGTIRSGELTTAAGVPIRHTIKGVLNTSLLYCAPDTDGERDLDGPGWKWPARSADGGACDPQSNNYYSGNDPRLVQGSLLTVPVGATQSSLGLETEPGRKLFNAIKTYGFYIVEAGPMPNSWGNLQVEIKDPATRTVVNEVKQASGIDLGLLVTSNSTHSNLSGATLDFAQDMDRIFEALAVVTNTSPTYPKGPPSAVPVVTITAPDNLAHEAGLTTGQFRISRNCCTATSLTVTYSRSGSATPGSDFVGVGTSKTILAGQAAVSFVLTPLQDTIDEPNETVTLTLIDGAAYTLGSPSQAMVTIVDND